MARFLSLLSHVALMLLALPAAAYGIPTLSPLQCSGRLSIMNTDDNSVPMSCFSPTGERVTPREGLDWATMCGSFKVGINNGVTVIMSTSAYEKSHNEADLLYCYMQNQIFTCGPAASAMDSGMILKKSGNSLFPGNPSYLEACSVPARGSTPRQPRSSQFAQSGGTLQSVERGAYSVFCDQTRIAASGQVVAVDGRPMRPGDRKWFKYANRPRPPVPGTLESLFPGN